MWYTSASVACGFVVVRERPCTTLHAILDFLMSVSFPNYLGTLHIFIMFKGEPAYLSPLQSSYSMSWRLILTCAFEWAPLLKRTVASPSMRTRAFVEYNLCGKDCLHELGKQQYCTHASEPLCRRLSHHRRTFFLDCPSISDLAISIYAPVKLHLRDCVEYVCG